MTSADSKSTGLLTVPLEIRHTIFKYVTVADREPKKVFQQWFEKKDIVAQKAQTPNAIVQPCFEDFDTEDDDNDGDGDGDGDEDEDAEDEAEDAGTNAQVDNEDDEEAEDEIEDGEQQVADQEGDSMTTNTAEEEEQHSAIADHSDAGLTAAHGEESEHVPQSIVPGGEDMIIDTGEHDVQELEQSQMVELGNSQENTTEGDGEDADAEGDNNHMAVPTTNIQATPAPVIRPHHKWRHIRKFLRINICPPPIGLLLVCSQLSHEALDWYYDAAVLDIKATTSFMHAAFFEDSLQELTDAAFSPMENIRRANIEIIYDTAWIRASEAIDDIFQAFLRRRLQFVVDILRKAPSLKELTIHWHDSAQDPEATAFKIDVLDPFYDLIANIEVKEYYIASDFEPRARSKEGRQRLEYQDFHAAMQSGRVEF